MAYDKKALKQGYSVSPDDSEFLRVDADPWTAAGDRGSDATGPERGAKGWDGSDNDSFLKASQSQTLPGTSRTVDSIYSDAMADQGPGPYGEGGGPVSEVGGNTARRRYSPTSSQKARDRQSNGGV